MRLNGHIQGGTLGEHISVEVAERCKNWSGMTIGATGGRLRVMWACISKLSYLAAAAAAAAAVAAAAAAAAAAAVILFVLCCSTGDLWQSRQQDILLVLI